METPFRLPNILVTGTPGTGKTTFCQILAHQLNSLLAPKTTQYSFAHIELSKLISSQHLYTEWDNENNCSIFDEDMVLDHMETFIMKGGFIVDFHTSAFFPERYFDLVFVLTCNSKVLYERLKKREYSEKKIENNMDCEIFGECKAEAEESYKKEIVFCFANNEEKDMGAIVEQAVGLVRKKGNF